MNYKRLLLLLLLEPGSYFVLPERCTLYHLDTDGCQAKVGTQPLMISSRHSSEHYRLK